MKKYIIIAISLVSTVFCTAQNVVEIDLTTQKFIGNESELNREKYFSMHISYNDWELSDDPEYLYDNLGIKFGRSFGGPGPFAKNKKDDLSIQNAQDLAKKNAARFKDSPLYAKYKTRDLIITDHPRDAFQLNGDYNKAAEFNAAYIKNGFPEMPKYYEVMNEPFVHAIDFVKTYNETNGVIIEMSKFHKIVADKIHEKVPNIMVGGYSAAWPEYDKNNFAIWNSRMKEFMDIAGESMQFFATHIYDGRNVEGDFNYRSGSNSEAILDLIEAYSYKKWDVVKPHLISEYGYTAKGLQGKPYSPELNAICLKSYNNILMSLLDKPDRLLKAVPFITGKANWFYNAAENTDQHPYPWVLMRKTEDGTFKYTHLRKFFELWKGVEGNRIEVASNNPDIQVNAFTKKGKAFIALNNLADDTQTLKLNFLNSSDNFIKNTTIRRLFANEDGIPKLVFFTNVTDLKEIEIKAGETVILECDTKEYDLKNKLNENNYYTKSYLQPITANTKMSFTVEKVEQVNNGRAFIKMGIGRAHNLSKNPKVTINGVFVKVPSNWAGYDQAGREQFFGVINIPVTIKSLKEGNNVVEITFPDTGGFVSSIIINTEKITKI